MRILLILFCSNLFWSAFPCVNLMFANDTWRGWRGDGNGVSDNTDLPVQWSSEENVRWKAPVNGDGISSPIVWGDQVFVTTAIESSKRTRTAWGVAGIVAVLLALTLLAVATCSRPHEAEKSTSRFYSSSGWWVSILALSVFCLVYVVGKLGIVQPGVLAEINSFS